MFHGLTAQRLVVLFLAAALLFNFPLLALWDRQTTWFGVPVFPAALFLLWGGVIAMLGWLAESIDDDEPPRGGTG